jgi:hypothetical protein
MKKEQQTGKIDAFSLFPDLMRKNDGDIQPNEDNESLKPYAEASRKRQLRGREGGTAPPPPPDVSWLSQGIIEKQVQVEDKPIALILMPDGGSKGSVLLTLEKLGYHVDYSETADDAIFRFTSLSYAIVVLHTGFEKTASPAESKIHTFLARLPMDRRRLIFYILVGPEFQTFYNLEALSLSANLVVNDADVEQLPAIFKISYREYNELFGPLIESLDIYR